MKHFLIVAAILSVTPVVSGELRLSDFGREVVADGVHAVEVGGYLSNWVTVGATRVVVGESSIDTLRETLTTGVDAAPDGAFCVQDRRHRLSVLPGEAREEMVPVRTIIFERASPSVADCSLIPDLQVTAVEDIPAIGSSAVDISSRFDGPTPGDGRWAFRNRTMLGDDGANWLLVTTVSYNIRGGTVQAIAISQHTEESPTGLSRFRYWSPIVIAEQIDVRSFPSSLGPRLDPELRTFSDYDLTETDRDGHLALITDKDRSWLFTISVAEVSDEGLVLCIGDQALNGGSYRTLSAIGFKDGPEGLLVATAEPQDPRKCAKNR